MQTVATNVKCHQTASQSCADDVVGLIERDRQRLDVLSVKKEAKLSAREIPGVEEGKGEEV